MERRGQLELSFGMIFSIIMIIALVATAFYVIGYFLDLNKCTKVGLFYNDLKEEVDKAWASTISQGVFKGSLPRSIDSVCFGDLDQTFSQDDEEEHNYLLRFRNQDKNVFLYKPESSCDVNLGSVKAEHFETDNFFCVPVNDGQVSVKFSKGSFDPLVKLSE